MQKKKKKKANMGKTLSGIVCAFMCCGFLLLADWF